MSYELLSETQPKARKQYKCIWCAEPILKGEKHVYVSGVYDGEFQSNRFHPECLTAMHKDLRDNHEEDFMPYENKRGSTEPR